MQTAHAELVVAKPRALAQADPSFSVDADARGHSINPGRAISMTLAVTRGDHKRQDLALKR
jgi:hypothetical protein